MTKIDAITYGPKGIPTIYMDNGVTIPEPIIALLADTRRAHEETYDASMFIEAAWNAAHPIPETVKVIPSRTPLMTRTPRGISFTEKGFILPIDMRRDRDVERRTLTPLPEQEPEGWEESRFIYANGKMYERVNGEMGPHWVACGRFLQALDRDEVAKLNPRPIEIK